MSFRQINNVYYQKMKTTGINANTWYFKKPSTSYHEQYDVKVGDYLSHPHTKPLKKSHTPGTQSPRATSLSYPTRYPSLQLDLQKTGFDPLSQFKQQKVAVSTSRGKGREKITAANLRDFLIFLEIFKFLEYEGFEKIIDMFLG